VNLFYHQRWGCESAFVTIGTIKSELLGGIRNYENGETEEKAIINIEILNN
jgi:hypothetical protein